MKGMVRNEKGVDQKNHTKSNTSDCAYLYDKWLSAAWNQGQTNDK